MIQYQGWDHLCREPTMMDEDLVKEFYKGFTITSYGKTVKATYEIKGQTYSISSLEVKALLGIPNEGYSEYHSSMPKDMSYVEVFKNFCRGDPHDPSSKHLLPADRILHRLIVGNYLPRGGKLFNIKQFEGVILWKILSFSKINLPRLILLHMEAAKTGQAKALPYPAIVKKILQSEDIYEPASEVNCSMVLDAPLLGRMGYMKNQDDTWVPKTDTEEKGIGGAVREEEAAEDISEPPVEDPLVAIQSKLKSVAQGVMALLGRDVSVTEQLAGMLQSVQNLTATLEPLTEALVKLNETLVSFKDFQTSE